MTHDPHSLSRPDHVTVTHLSWKAAVNFDERVITAAATWRIQKREQANELILDTKELQIDSVVLDGAEPAKFRLSSPDKLLGQALLVTIGPATETVTVYYKTSPEAEALQWLGPVQTAGKKSPFLFTQSQAILARSWIPCQDSPGVRFTYDARVNVPPPLVALMSASNPDRPDPSGVYDFTMDRPIPSYLLALAVGEIEFRSVSGRAGIYAEPSEIERAVHEFADLEGMIAAAEKLYGEYKWERYDVIVLPPSFPFGGMENPRITFATPTILAGDRSLTSLIAHELAHSWSGNLVTNATWNDFWLNEGFTVYFEHRIMERLYGRDYSEMLSSLALQDLVRTIDELKAAGQYGDTRLRLELKGRNPDEGVTDIAYNKGYFFLRLIEETYGRGKFDDFLKTYFSSNAFSSMETSGFISFIKGFYKDRYQTGLPDSLFAEWIFSEGLPSSCPVPVSDRFTRVEELIGRWKKARSIVPAGTQSWSTHEWLHFLKNLPPDITVNDMARLDEQLQFTKSDNAEILTVWLTMAIRLKYEKAYPKLEDFLVRTGRRKFLIPLYTELVKTPEGREQAGAIYSRARPNYHFVSTNTIDRIVRGTP